MLRAESSADRDRGSSSGATLDRTRVGRASARAVEVMRRALLRFLHRCCGEARASDPCQGPASSSPRLKLHSCSLVLLDLLIERPDQIRSSSAAQHTLARSPSHKEHNLNKAQG